MDNRGSWSSCAFELEDIEIINHKTDRNEEKLEKWNCDQCSLFFLEKGKLDEHKKKHSHQDIVKCKYCNKDISSSSENRECYLNKKCETCEYKCTKCPKRFLRHSSLMNHEKKHTSPKTKRINRNKKVNGVATDNTPKALKRNHIDADDLEKQTKELKLPKSVNEGNSPKKEGFETQDDNKSTPSKISRRLSFKGSKSAERKNNCGVKSSKQPMSKNNSILEETCSDSKSNQSTIPCNSQTASSTINVLTNENVVNYKPFSCHVCGDTFASDNALLTHIRTHGENAIKSFKCKFCGDEFDDIYKMQYHLAICPLAEDELEFKQVIPTNIPTKYSGGISTPRKRGRPKKIREVNSNEEESNNESIPQLSSKRGNVKRRKEEDTENIPNEIVQNSLAPPNQSNDSPEKEQLSGPNTIGVDEDDIDLMSGDITEIRDYEPSDDRKKIHLCPFPQCDFKFTREKALLCHMRNHSDDFDDSLKCHKCDIPFDDIHALRQHINSCKGIKEEKDDDFSRADLYDSSPNRTLHRPKRDYFVCNQCGKSYQNQEKLNRCTHEAPHTEASTVCRICGVETEDEFTLKKHFKSTHPKCLPYQCPECEVEFISFTAVRKHRETHVNEGEKFMCVVCSAKFPTYKILYFHYNKDHVEQHEKICKICTITFPNSMALEEHNYVRHKSKDRFKCIFCPKVYSSSVNLSVHMKTHANRIYKCKICYRPFTDQASLFQHMLFHASDLGTERPLKCAVCLSAYAKKSALKYHILGHITKGDSSFLNCLICGETLPDNESMSKHIFEHSIRVTENNMTKRETEWVTLIKQRKCIKQGRPPKSSNINKLDYKPSLNSEISYPHCTPNLRQKNNGIESEKSLIKRGRGRPRKISLNEIIETSETKYDKGRPKKQSKDLCALKTTSTIKSSETVEQNNQPSRNPRRSQRLVEDTVMRNFKLNRDINDKKGEEKLKVQKCDNKVSDESSVTSTVQETNPLSSKSETYGNSAHLIEKRILTNSGETRDFPDTVNQSEKIKTVVVSKSQVSQSGSKSCASSHNHYTSYPKNNEINEYSENKVRPMSFKIFSSMNSKRALKIVNKEFRNHNQAKGEPTTTRSTLSELDLGEEIFDDEDPLSTIEIPSVSEEKDVSNSSFENEENKQYDPENNNLSTLEESSQHNESEQIIGTRSSNGFIKEKKYFEPSRGLTKYSCTTCFSSFSSQDDLLFHNTTHIL